MSLRLSVAAAPSAERIDPLSMVIFYEKGFMAFNYAVCILFEYCVYTRVHTRPNHFSVKNRPINLPARFFSSSRAPVA